MKRTRSIVRGIGSYLPRRRLTNQDLEKVVETSHEWIVQRTGIEARHIADDDETTSVLGTKAAESAHADSAQDRRDSRERHAERLGDLGRGEAQPPQRHDRVHPLLGRAVGDSRGRRRSVV